MICNECGTNITEYCSNHKLELCNPCHRFLEQGIRDNYGTAVRDNDSCNCVEIALEELHGVPISLEDMEYYEDMKRRYK